MDLDTIKTCSAIDKTKPEIIFSSLQVLFETLPYMIFVKDINSVYVACTHSFANMSDLKDSKKIIGKTDFEIFKDQSLARRYVNDDKKLLENGKNLVDYVEPLTDKNGKQRFSSTSKYILRDANNNPIGILGTSKDITKKIVEQQRFKKEIQYMFTLPQDAYTAIFLDINDWRIISQKRQKIHDYEVPNFDNVEHFLKIAKNITETSEDAHHFYNDFSKDYLISLSEEGRLRIVMQYLRTMTDNNSHWVRDEITMMTDPENGHLCLVLIVKDIDEKKLKEKKLIKNATIDSLTNLLNRAETKKRVQEFLAKDDKDFQHAALMMIDVDNFKLANDIFGHPEGDKILVQIAKDIKECFRECDIIGRLGGDEFFVLMKNISSKEAIEAKAKIILDRVQTSCSNYKEANLSVSIGISLYKQKGETLPELYKEADEALYLAKKMGKNQFAFAKNTLAFMSSNSK